MGKLHTPDGLLDDLIGIIKPMGIVINKLKKKKNNWFKLFSFLPIISILTRRNDVKGMTFS